MCVHLKKMCKPYVLFSSQWLWKQINVLMLAFVCRSLYIANENERLYFGIASFTRISKKIPKPAASRELSGTRMYSMCQRTRTSAPAVIIWLSIMARWHQVWIWSSHSKFNIFAPKCRRVWIHPCKPSSARCDRFGRQRSLRDSRCTWSVYLEGGVAGTLCTTNDP